MATKGNRLRITIGFIRSRVFVGNAILLSCLGKIFSSPFANHDNEDCFVTTRQMKLRLQVGASSRTVLRLKQNEGRFQVSKL